MFAHNPDNKSMYLASPVICKIDEKIMMLGVYSPVIGDNESGKEKKPRSIAVFSLEGECLESGVFKLQSIANQKYENGFDFWHMDCFEWQNIKYCIVTPESGNEIRIGKSSNGVNYIFCDKPLLHAYGFQKVPYMYKPSGVIINGRFHLFYPSRKKEIVHIFCTSIDFNDISDII